MLEDIDCFLGSGEIPNLFSADEEAEIIHGIQNAVRASGQPDTKVSDNHSRSIVRDCSPFLILGEVQGLSFLEVTHTPNLGLRGMPTPACTLKTHLQVRCMAFFTARVRDHLHMVLCLDPAGPLFRERIRHFPSLVNWR